MALEDGVGVALLVEGELVLEARAAAAAHADPQAREGHVGVLRGEELAHLLGSLVGDRDHCYPKYSARRQCAILA